MRKKDIHKGPQSYASNPAVPKRPRSDCDAEGQPVRKKSAVERSASTGRAAATAPPPPPPLSFKHITTLGPLPHLPGQPCNDVTNWSDVKLLRDKATKTKYVDAWLDEYNKKHQDEQLEWSDTVSDTYVTSFSAFAAMLEKDQMTALVFQEQLSELLTRKTHRTLAQELEKDAKWVLRGQFSVTTSEMQARTLNGRVPDVDPLKHIELIALKLDPEKATLVGGASGSGKTQAAIQSATKWIKRKKKSGCVMYYAVKKVMERNEPAKNLSEPTEGDAEVEPTEHFKPADIILVLTEATDEKNVEKLSTLLKPLDLSQLLAMMEAFDKLMQKKNKNRPFYHSCRAAVFVKLVERIAGQCTTHFAKLTNTTEDISVALVLDEVGDKPYLVRAACSFFDSTQRMSLPAQLHLSDSVELAVVLCGTGVGAASCLGGSHRGSYTVNMLTPTSAEKLWTTLRTTYSELEVADRVSPTCRAMGSSNARMAMLLLECLDKRNTAGHKRLKWEYANVLATAESIPRDAAKRFQEMNGFDEVKFDKMLELYGQALRACVWHTDPKKDLEHSELLTQYGAITDLRTIVRENVVAANGSETKGRCFTMAPAMMAFFRIMLSYDCVVPVDVTGESFEHAMLHYVCAALLSCAGRSVRDFLSLIVTDPKTILQSPDTKLKIPSDINKTLLMLSLGHRKFDKDCLALAIGNGKADKSSQDPENGKQARATKEVLDLAFTEKKEKGKTRTLEPKCPVVLLNGSKAQAADIIVMVPGVLVCHVQCKDYVADKKLVEKEKKDGNEKFVAEYEKMTQPLCLAPCPQYYIMATTSADSSLEQMINKRKIPLLVLRVPRTSNPPPTTSPSSSDISDCAFLQSLVQLCKADVETGMILLRGEDCPAVKKQASLKKGSR